MIIIKKDRAERLRGDFSYFVSFPYSLEIVNVMRSLITKIYHPDKRVWEISESELKPLCDKLNDKDIPYICNEIKNPVIVEEPLKESFDLSILNNVNFKTEPYKYQKEGIVFGLNHPCFLLADEQGLGKTIQALNIAILRKEKEKFKHCLIITGYNTLKDNWLKEIEKHTNESGWIIGTRQKVKSGQVYVGDSKDKLQDLDNLSSNPHFFLITNVQSLQIVKKIKYGKKTRNEYIFADKINNLCKTNEIGMVIFDEFQVCKNITSLQTKALLRIKDSPNKVAATGTPIMNKAMDCYPLLSWLENKYINYKEFQDRYCVMGGFMNRQCIGDKNMHELHNRIKPLMLRRLKEDVLDLPDKVYIEDYLEMTDKQNLLYKQIKSETLLKISEAKKKKDLTIFTKLRQLTSHSCLATDDIQKCSSINDLIQYSQIFESIKFDRIKQLVEEISANNRKVIIFTNFKRAAYLLQDALKEYNPLAIHGDIKETSIRLKIVEQFQEKDNNKVLIGTIKAMGTGLTLTAASNVIFLDEPWNKALKDQCCDRCHRIGAKETIFIRTLICKNTLDEKINAIVKSKGALADMLIDGVPRDYEVFINYLFDL